MILMMIMIPIRRSMIRHGIWMSTHIYDDDDDNNSSMYYDSFQRWWVDCWFVYVYSIRQVQVVMYMWKDEWNKWIPSILYFWCVVPIPSEPRHRTSNTHSFDELPVTNQFGTTLIFHCKERHGHLLHIHYWSWKYSPSDRKLEGQYESDPSRKTEKYQYVINESII